MIHIHHIRIDSQEVELVDSGVTFRFKEPLATAAFDREFEENIAGTFLTQLGVPVVIAMRLPISEKRGEIFTRWFYEYLTAGHPIPEALRLSRHRLWDDNPDMPGRMWEFAVPVLFMHQDLLGKDLVLVRPGKDQKAEVHLKGASIPLDKEELFVGRREELVKTAKLMDTDADYRGNVALVHGTGGIGKTAFALEAGHRFCEGFEAAIFVSARKREEERGKLPPELEKELKAATARYRTQDVATFLTQIANEVGLTPQELPAASLYKAHPGLWWVNPKRLNFTTKNIKHTKTYRIILFIPFFKSLTLKLIINPNLIPVIFR